MKSLKKSKFTLYAGLVSVVLSFLFTMNTFSQEESPKGSTQSPKSVGREFNYTGSVVWQGMSFDKSDRQYAVLLELREHQDVQFRIDLSDADRFGVTTERRTRIFIGSRVEIKCREVKSKHLNTCKVTSFKWIEKKIVEEGRPYEGTLEYIYFKKIRIRKGIKVIQLFIKLAEYPEFDFMVEGKPLECSVANWLGLLDRYGKVQVESGVRVNLTCVKFKTKNIFRVTSLGFDNLKH